VIPLKLYPPLADLNDAIMNLPPPADSGEWMWRTVGIVLSIVIGAAGAIFGAWSRFRERRLEKDIASEQQKQAVELEELKYQFEARKQLHEHMAEANSELILECRSMREELRKSQNDIAERDRNIAEKQGLIAQLTSTVQLLQEKVARLEAHVAKLEAKSEQKKEGE